MFTPKTSIPRPFKMTKVLLRNAILLLGLFTLLAIFIIATVSRNNDLLSHSDSENPRIGGQRPSSDFHRTKRDLWYFFSKSEMESYFNSEECESETEFRCQSDGECIPISAKCDGIIQCIDESDEFDCFPKTCPVGKQPCSNGVCIDQEFWCDEHFDCLDGSDEANCLDLDEPQTGQDNKPLSLIAKDDTGGQKTGLDENVSAVRTSSQKRKTRLSGEDPEAYINDINRVEGDDEDGYGSDLESGSESGSGSGSGSGDGSDEVEESADASINFTSHLKPHLDIDVEKPVPLPGLESRPGPKTPTHFYRVTMIINEPYRPSLADRNSDEFRKLSSQLCQAIDGLYQSALPDQWTHTKILTFVQTSDPVAIWVYLDIESTSADIEKNHSIFAEQLQLHTLGNIRARPDGFSLRNVQDLDHEECEFETEFRCKSDGECITITEECDGIIQCIDGSDEADCSPLETTTIVEVPEAATDRIESLLKAVENEGHKIDDLIETVQRMKDALEKLTTANKLLTQQIVELRIANAKRN